ncbi:23S rRNA (adenine(2030)-N(6))-methyltransferase RlmJ [Gluconacetobacter takamatsuzukensis]|uniref:Ribosomal RNA large subunit methyltransferase J n=1 Tax=Gluconacetobacter takamatsuzukensis TaxID=1286190 RepID=A0A7W4KCU0_9PROT|nr:23S rRNA (adenine(2030)-N(6))-methyltransferase RlmJ [Gluconacetobacter takamatsuzukensis]MBB2204553.1 23S rRNA (adenine(2030)-N(6))-methyltransferase RlmJ [Gluconacetobacter takamatsuzukensis]
MNYRHAFHAGNFADCMKHALLVLLLQALARKPAAFSVLDTHAGIGRYDLGGDQATRTMEWQGGIGRLLDAPPADLPPAYLDLVRQAGAPAIYPGSPLIAAMMLRPQDRLVCCELHPEDSRMLRRLFAGNSQVSIHARDGYAALGALLPPREARRGLVLIDPPFEQPDEFARLVEGLATAHRRFAAGILAGWYPIKHRAPVRAFLDSLRDSGIRDIVALELTLRPPLDPARLNGCGLVVINPPFGFAEAALPALRALTHLSPDGTGEASVTRIVEE